MWLSVLSAELSAEHVLYAERTEHAPHTRGHFVEQSAHRTFRTAATDQVELELLSGGWRPPERSRGQRLGWRVTIMFSSNPHLQ